MNNNGQRPDDSGFIPYGHQDVDENDVAAVVRVLKSDFLTQGPAVGDFENDVARYCGAPYAVAVSNATAALHLACVALELGAGESLWTSPITFVASTNCALYCGASVDFVDIDARTRNLSVESLRVKLEKAAASGQLPKIVVPVHLAGLSCDMQEIGRLSKKYGFRVLEDASHAIGGRYKGEPVGSCAFSDVAVFSFHPVKVMTTGEGGIIVTRRRDLYEKLLRLRTHGITQDERLYVGPSHGPWYYEQVDLGFNYRMTDIQAALGSSQLKRLDAFVRRRNELAARYDEALKGLPLELPASVDGILSARHLYVVRVKKDGAKEVHRAAFEALRKAGVGVQLHYIPVYRQPYYGRFGFRPEDFSESEAYYAEAMSLPLYYGLTEAQQDRVVHELKRVLA